MRINHSLIKHATMKASQSICNYKVSAIALRNGDVIASANSRPRFTRPGGGIHAEMAVLHKAGPSIDTIVICRVNGSGKILPIEPCKRCKKILDKLNIKIITIKNNW